MTYTVTLGIIRAHDPCQGSWKCLLKSLGKIEADETSVSIEYILDLLGLDDALWVLRALPAEHDSAVRMLACDLAETALKHTEDLRPAEALRVARAYARGKATVAELADAREAAREAAWAATHAAARAAAAAAAAARAREEWAAADVAAHAARHAAREAVAWEECAAADAAARVDQERIFRAWLQGSAS